MYLGEEIIIFKEHKNPYINYDVKRIENCRFPWGCFPVFGYCKPTSPTYKRREDEKKEKTPVPPCVKNIGSNNSCNILKSTTSIAYTPVQDEYSGEKYKELYCIKRHPRYPYYLPVLFSRKCLCRIPAHNLVE